MRNLSPPAHTPRPHAHASSGWGEAPLCILTCRKSRANASMMFPLPPLDAASARPPLTTHGPQQASLTGVGSKVAVKLKPIHGVTPSDGPIQENARRVARCYRRLYSAPQNEAHQLGRSVSRINREMQPNSGGRRREEIGLYCASDISWCAIANGNGHDRRSDGGKRAVCRGRRMRRRQRDNYTKGG